MRGTVARRIKTMQGGFAGMKWRKAVVLWRSIIAKPGATVAKLLPETRRRKQGFHGFRRSHNASPGHPIEQRVSTNWKYPGRPGLEPRGKSKFARQLTDLDRMLLMNAFNRTPLGRGAAKAKVYPHSSTRQQTRASRSRGAFA